MTSHTYTAGEERGAMAAPAYRFPDFWTEADLASPSTEDHDRTVKVLKYAQAGIPAY
jgi:hypothetical protein